MVKELIKGTLRLLGFQLQRLSSEESESNEGGWIKAMGVKTVLDIGANTGQFATQIRELLPEAMIYSFEPLADCFEQLQRNMPNSPRFKSFNFALGDKIGTFPFETNEFSPSSSFLNVATSHQIAFPYTSKTHSTTVSLQRLDDLEPELDLISPLLIKIDVQGYEDHVLRGGEATIRRAEIVIIETSFETLYEGQPLFDHIYSLLVSWGFAYKGSVNHLSAPQDGRPLQEDSLFVKRH